MNLRKGAISVGALVVIFMSALVAVIFLGPAQDALINNVNQTGAGLENYTGGALAIGNQIPLFLVLMVVAVVIAPVAMEFKRLD